MKRSIFVCLLVGLILSGCGFKDLDKRFFVLAIGVDKSENPEMEYRVSLKLGIPSSRIEPGQTNRYQVVTQEAKTITEAIRLLKSQVDKELDFGHAKMIVFGKSLAEENVQKPLDWFMRRRDIQMVGFVAIGDPSAIEVLDTKVLSERLPANSLFLSFDREGTESSYIITENLSDFYRRLTERGKDPYLPIIQPQKNSYTIDQVAILDKNKVIAILTPDQTRVLNELARQFHKIEIHTEQGQDTFELAINHYKMTYKLEHLKDNEEPQINVHISMDGMAEEATLSIFDQNWIELQKLAEKQSKDRALEVLHILQKNKVDPIGFGLRYRAMGYVSENDWERWQSHYPDIQINVKVNVKILGSGVIK
ncbi:Ger(x)C family spore germination protein [Paenibacillus sp. N3.4]|uniref:Ger(x)C family spore germination protein n=1 Tax=Paenibacillus sp. N3.4 TaxID=2603222 RepID=UPI0016509D7D|nr:Ger(x)C family spore germination protein [Paenibacillus sp. N3.4]